MKVLVLAKLVPNADTVAAIDDATKRLVREGAPMLDEADTYGIEVALRLVEAAGQGEVTVASMTASEEEAPFRTALAMGAHRIVVVSDDALAGSDALGTAKVLAAVVRRESPDLVIAGTESADGYTGTLPVQLAELCGLPSVTFARHVELAGQSLLAQRQTEGGYDEVTCPMPAVITVTAGAVEVRYPTIRGIMAARSKPIERLSLMELGIDASIVGSSGAGEEVIEVTESEARPPGRVIVDEGAAEVEIIELLRAMKII